MAVEHQRRASYGPNSPVVGERGARTRQAVIDAALESFEVNGLDGTTVDSIADTAGISRATLYQYFESKDQIFVELIRKAAADLLEVIRALGPIGPTAESVDTLRSWLGEWSRVQDRYRVVYLQWAVFDSPAVSLQPLVAEQIVAYVSLLSPLIEAATGDDDLDSDSLATVLLPLLFRLNDFRQKGMTRTLTDEQLLDGTATFLQLVLFPSTPSQQPARVGAIRVAARRGRKSLASRPGGPGPAETGQPPEVVQRILDAAATTFATRGFHHSSVKDVLQLARAGRGTFYKHFDDKTDLFVRLAADCMHRLETLAGRFGEVISDDDAAALRDWLAESLALHRRYRGVLRGLLQEESRQPALKELRMRSGAAILRSFDDALASVDRRHPFDVRVGSLVLLALLERGPDYSFGTTYDLSDDEVLDVLAVLVGRGLLGRAA